MPIDARHPKEIRADIRAGRLAGVTAGLAPGFVQANLAVLPRDAGLRLPPLLPAQPAARARSSR